MRTARRASAALVVALSCALPAFAATHPKRPAPMPTLAVVVHGAGHVFSTPSGIRCPPTCRHAFPAGQSLTLFQVPAATSVFSGWKGGCSGVTCRLRLAKSATVVAAFTRKQPPAPPNTSPALPPPAPTATPGHYAGTSSQNERVALDVSGDGVTITSFDLANANYDCSPNASAWAGPWDAASVPIAQDGSFTFTWSDQSNQPDYVVEQDATLSGTVKGSTASGTFQGTTVWTGDASVTSYTCRTPVVTWTATRTP